LSAASIRRAAAGRIPPFWEICMPAVFEEAKRALRLISNPRYCGAEHLESLP
jgi:hypothetical protein